MTTFTISLPHVQLLLFIFLRVSTILFLVPIFDSRAIPLTARVGLSLAISLMVFPHFTTEALPVTTDAVSLGLAIFREILLGAMIALIIRTLFAGIQIAGQVAATQMGLSMANVMDPISNAQISSLAQFQYIFALLVFLTLDGHHSFIAAIAESFVRVPAYGAIFSGNAAQSVVDVGRQMFIIAIKTGAPLLVSLLLASVALGIVSRTVPQMNVFMVAMPAKVFLGMIVWAVALPFWVSFLEMLISQIMTDVRLLLRALA